MAYILKKHIMVIIETSIFTRRITELLSDDEYRELQATLVKRPKAGPVIPGSGGIRKLRWSASGRGKRGGVSVVVLVLSTIGQLDKLIY